MQIPAAMFIESAADGLKDLAPFARRDQLRELASFGNVRAHNIGATGLSNDFEIGYLLGLQTARVILSMNGLLAMKGIDSRDLL